MVTALVLSASDRRARREAERPEISCGIARDPELEPWLQFEITLDNPSRKYWAVERVEAVSPPGLLLARADDVVTSNTFGTLLYDRERFASAAATRIRMSLTVSPFTAPTGEAFRTAGRANGSFFIRRPPNGSEVQVRLHIASRGPRPDRYEELLVRLIDPPITP